MLQYSIYSQFSSYLWVLTQGNTVVLKGESLRLMEKELGFKSDLSFITDLGKIITIKGKPDFTVITRFKEDRPQYRVGHRERINAARSELKREFPNVKLAGASYDGVGLPDCINQGKAAVEEVIADLFT